MMLQQLLGRFGHLKLLLSNAETWRSFGFLYAFFSITSTAQHAPSKEREKAAESCE